ncbi:hypothetical protein Asp14428_06450 [Actinoplanes sp. NBRC 14428]|nr:hypothetical protein Asp14428_06450 [Actinoplanes sp. NBRC 14428]
MTVKAANATGRISAPVRPGCGTAPMKGAARGTEDVIFSSGKGLILIPAYGDAATPEGIRVGSTFARLTRAYPDFSAHLEGEEFTGTGTVFGGKEDGHPGVHYRFDVRDNKVAGMALEHDHQDCYE